MAIKLADIYKELGPDRRSAKVIRSCLLLNLWPEVAGKKISQHTEPVKIVNRTLYLSASSPSWAQEISFLKREIISRFNAAAGEEAIQDIRFKAPGG